METHAERQLLYVGDLIATPEEAERAFSLGGALVVVSNCGYPYLVTDDEHGVLIKSPGDDGRLHGEPLCCWPWTVVWTYSR